MKKKMINLNDFIPSKYNELIYNILNNKYPKYSIWGGRAGVKSTLLALLILIFLSLSVTFGGGNVMVFRKFKANMRKSLYAEIGKVAARIGIKDKYEFYKSPLMIVNKKTKHIALFDGLYDYQGVKGTTFENGVPCKLVIYEEFQEFEDLDDVEDNNLTFTRGGEEDEEIEYEYLEENSCPILYAWNPVDKLNTFQYEKFRETTDDMFCLHVTYLDVPKKWLGKAFIREAERIKQLDEALYNFRFLGLVSGKEGLVFKNIEDYTVDKSRFKTLQRGLDFGTAKQGDPTAYVVAHYDEKNKDLYIVDEWYKKDTDYPEIAVNILKENRNNFTVYCDNQDSGGIKQLIIEGVSKARGCKKGSVDNGIIWLRGLNNIYIDKNRTPHTYKEFTEYSYVYKRKAQEYVLDDKNNHTIDATRYALSDFIEY
jgi:phage terminase large subunit